MAAGGNSNLRYTTILGICVAGTACLLLMATMAFHIWQDQGHVVIRGGYYHGKIDDFEIGLSWADDSMACTAWLVDRSRGLNRLNYYAFLDGDGFAFEPFSEKPPWLLQAQVVEDGGIAEISLSDPAIPATSRTMRLPRITPLGMIRRNVGIRIGWSGRQLRYQASFPVFEETSRFLGAINERMRMDHRSQSVSWADLTPADILDSLQYPSCMNVWQCDVNYKLVFLAPEFISMVAQREEYTGGAHGVTGYQSYNFAWVNGKLVNLHLADLFDPNSNWLSRLSAACVKDLRRQGASSVTGDSITEFGPEDLKIFTADARGLTFYFASYQVGCYAEGTFEALAPLEAFQETLRRDHALASVFGRRST